MARHSKWHKVRQFKGAIDAKRSASFTKLAREITVAAREKGEDPLMNAGLRAAIDRARAVSMPKENIERAIQKGVGGSGEGVIETLTYEGYAPGGTALIIECLTDNRNRTANDVKHLLSKNGGTLAGAGSVTYLFDHVGIVRIPTEIPPARRDECELLFIDAGATNIVDEDGATEIESSTQDLAHVAEAVRKAGFISDTVEFQWIPKMLVETDEEKGMQVSELIEQLETHDDVSRVFSNLA
ncbi:YebC/PmpR family DNA-binding transcriptional regulator [Patescibacteria group bacterium]|nr:YebC/PmpR family DNA-binding transcriptional regulator [Patescibacteria group bacterium]